jgi:hydantoinase/carbamoylase family amidase
LELHIEQSESLAIAGKQIGIVTKIVGRSTYNFNFFGEATHAATTSRYKQRDALQGAARFINTMHEMARADYPEGVVNCGNIHVEPGAYNVVPALASLQVECRHHDETVLSEMESRLVHLAHECATGYQLKVSAKNVLRRSVAIMNQGMIDTITMVCEEQGRTHMPIISYAGHDAQILSPILPSAMIFIPSQGGISHSPKEYTTWEDVTAGANVMLQTLLNLVLKV